MSASTVDPVMLTRLTRAAQEALVSDATERAHAGRPPLDEVSQEALVDHVVRRELESIDRERLAAGQPPLAGRDARVLMQRVAALVVGLGPVEVFLADPTVEEIAATRWDLVFVYRADGSVELATEPLWGSEAELEAWLAHLARTAGRTERAFNARSPLLVLRLRPGLRLAATRDASEHVTFALRRNTLGDVTTADLVHNSTFPPSLAELFRAFMRAGMRVVFSGATAAGKTTVARACLGDLPSMVRVVVIEDTAEVDLFDDVLHPNVESWEARQANNEGEGAIAMGDLVRHSLRYRPDWLTVGEVRDSDAAVPMIKAMTHGQASLTTVHAASAVGALDKLALYLATGEDRLPTSVAHQQLAQAVDFVVHLDRLPGGQRVVAEVVEVAGFDEQRCTTNTIALRDEATGETTLLNRLVDRHRTQLRRAGFDDRVLGGVYR